MIRRSAIIMLLLLLFGVVNAQNIAINEFLAANDTTVADQDGEYDDWLELYNYSSETISLNGWYLSDDDQESDKWVFPDTQIAANSFLIVWTDDDTDQIGLHTNFKLSASGESIILSDSLLQIVDQVTFGVQTTDISTGRYPDGTGEFQLMYPTFGTANNSTSPDTTDPGDSIFVETKVHTVKLYFDIENWEDTLKYYFEDLDEEYYQVSVTFDDTLVLDSVGVRYKGNSSYVQSSNTPKKPFKLKFDEFISDQTLLGQYVLNMHNCINDPSFMREAIGYHIAREIMNAPRTAYTNLYVNDTLIGLYSVVEQVDELFLADNFDNNQGNLYKAGIDGANLGYMGDDQAEYESDYELKTNEDENDWSRFIEMIDKLNNTADDVFVDTMQNYLNLDRCARLLAFNMALSSFDSYTGSGRNYYLYDNETSGQFEMIPWDMNECFGVYTNGWDVLTQDVVDISNLATRPLNYRIIGNDSLQEVYLSYIEELITGPASYDSVTAMTVRLKAAIENHVEADINKFYDYQDFVDNIEEDVTVGLAKLIPGLKAFSQTRNAYLALQLDAIVIYPGDTDNNGVVEAEDILPIALYFLTEGYERSTVSVTWGRQRSLPWDTQATTYADANGDGVIDEADVIGIGVNWGNSHETSSASYAINPDDHEMWEPYRANLEALYNHLTGESEPVLQMRSILKSILDDSPELPYSYQLEQNYPNPFNQETIISFSIDERRAVSLSVYDILGKLVARPVQDKVYDAGTYQIHFDAGGLSSGVYFYSLESSEKNSIIHRMTIIK